MTEPKEVTEAREWYHQIIPKNDFYNGTTSYQEQFLIAEKHIEAILAWYDRQAKEPYVAVVAWEENAETKAALDNYDPNVVTGTYQRRIEDGGDANNP